MGTYCGARGTVAQLQKNRRKIARLVEVLEAIKVSLQWIHNS